VMGQKLDMVNAPPHYHSGASPESRGLLKILGFKDSHFQEECILAMISVFGPRAVFWFCLLTVVKYLWRAGQKGNAQMDYDKARWYAKRALKDGKAAQMWRFRLEDTLKEIPGHAD